MKPRDRSLGSSRTLSLLVSLVLISLVLILVSQSPQLAPVQNAVQGVLAPIQNAINATASGLGGAVETFRRNDDVRRENEQLRQQIESLTAENTKVDDLNRQIADLQSQVRFEREFPSLNGIGAAVLSRDPAGLSQILVIDRGSADGVHEQQAVTNAGGLFIGRVRAVPAAHRAEVLLVTDVDSSVSVYVDRTGANGVLEGRWPTSQLRVRHVLQDTELGKGDLLKTAGTGLVPRGLLIGQVYAVYTNDVQSEQEADAYTLATLGAVDQVLVILGGEGLAQPTATPTVAPTATATPLPTLTPPRPTVTPKGKP